MHYCNIHTVMYLCSVKCTSDGMQSLITLAKGDMRKALNILQVNNSVINRLLFLILL